MLTSFTIKNFALIEDIQVSFSSGLTIITGETGAGKSILLEGLSLILGKRADLSSIKNPKKKCIIEGTFDIANYNLKLIFKNHDIDYEPETIIRREILPSGKSRAFVNDSPVNLNVLLKLGQFLIDIHSQHQNLELTDNLFQFQIIDALANTKEDLISFKLKRNAWQEANASLQNLRTIKSEAVKEQDYNTFLLNELKLSELDMTDLNALETELKTLSNVEEIKEMLIHSNQLLSDEQLGILQAITVLKNNLKNLAEISTSYADVDNRIGSVFIELDDIYSEIQTAQENLVVDPSRLDQVNEKLSKIHDLFIKHSVSSIKELHEIEMILDKKVNLFENIDLEIEEKLKEIEILESNLSNCAVLIHDKRIKAIPNLTKQLEIILEELGMEHAKFNIILDYAEEFRSNGKDELSFMFTANKGSDFMPLEKAASGGELSRIMLAIKSILSKYTLLPTIMFDEIDSGVSGEISNKMAGIMKHMSTTMQVFAITHLPQIAAKGDTHFKVHKEELNNQTNTKLSKLNADDRIVEIAQMLGGTKMTTSAIAHAKQLLN